MFTIAPGDAAVDPVAAGFLHREHRGAHVHGERGVELARADVERGAVGLQARVVHEHVDAAEALDGRRDHPARASIDAEVGGVGREPVGVRVAARERVQPVGEHVGREHDRALVEERVDDAAADAARGPRHDHPSSVEPHRVLLPSAAPADRERDRRCLDGVVVELDAEPGAEGGPHDAVVARADRRAHAVLEGLGRHRLLEVGRAAERERHVQVRGLDHGVAVADQLHVETGVGRDLHQRARGRRTAGERDVEAHGVPRWVAQHVGDATAHPRSHRPRRGSGTPGTARRSPRYPSRSKSGRGASNHRTPTSAHERATARRPRRSYRPSASCMSVRSRERHAQPTAASSASRAGSPHACSFTAPNPSAISPCDRVEVGPPRRAGTAPRRTRAATSAPGSPPSASHSGFARSPCREIPQCDVDRGAHRRRERRRAVLGEQGGDEIAVVGVDPDEPRHDRAQRLERRPVPVAERIGVVRADAGSAVGVDDAHERGGREDLVGMRAVYRNRSTSGASARASTCRDRAHRGLPTVSSRRWSTVDTSMLGSRA